MSKPKKVTVAEIEPVIEKYRGNVSAIARHFQVSRSTIQNRMNEAVTLKQAMQDARESLLDDAESELYRQAQSGNTTALIFLLKTQGKNRGYTERQEITGANGDSLKVKFIDYGLDESTD